jgi:aryl-alcohol dehydrogenase-like predicted oxidoreductase
MAIDATDSAAAAGTLTLGGDLEVRRLGFGAMRLTGEGIWGPPKDRETAKGVLRRAVELGVDFIDTADSYGPAVSEEVIAEALHPYPGGLVIATKGGFTRSGPGEWNPDGRPEHLREACEGSLRRLRLERIDLYQFHTVDPDVPFEESVGTLVELQDEGKIGHIGLSNVDADHLARAREIVPIVSVQNRYSIEVRDSEPVLEECEVQGIAFIPWYPLVAGNLAAGGSIARIAEAHDATRSQVALAWLLARSPLMLPIPGTSSVEHLEENVAAAGLRLAQEEFEELFASGG